MDYLQETRRRQKLEKDICDHVDYSGECNITFIGDFSFHMQAVQPSTQQSCDWLDADMQQDLQQGRIINWCRTADTLFPVNTKSDGNCLSHAVSMGVWGIPDTVLTLRNLIYVSIDTPGNRQRWQSQYETPESRTNFGLNRETWEKDWNLVIETASSTTTSPTTAVPFAHLEAIHIFTLANILRRPIIVLADATARTLSGTSIQESDIGGIYLPLDWPPGECYKYAIVLGYSMNHFCPLLPEENPNKLTYSVPIVARDGSSLPVRFLAASEEKKVVELLKSYLKIKEVPLSQSESMALVLCTEIKYSPLPNTKHMLMTLPPERTPSVGQTVPPSTVQVAATHFESVPCITPQCTFFGSPATGNMCSSCLNKYLQKESTRLPRAEPATNFQQNNITFNLPQTEPSAPPPSMPLSGQFIDLSMMGEVCKGGCGFRCSTKTYPYCHECAEKQRSAVKQSQTTNLLESSLFGSGAAAPQSTSSVSRKCRGEGCDRHGKVHLAELCEKCYMDEQRKKQICSSPGCMGLRGENGYCSSCQATASVGSDLNGYTVNEVNIFGMGYDKINQPHPTGLVDRNEEAESYNHENSSSLIESGTRCNAEKLSPPILTGSQDKIPCASPMCKTLIYPPNQLCQQCLDILRKNQVSGGQQQQHDVTLPEPTVISLKPNQDFNNHGVVTGRCNTSPQAVRQHMMKVKLSEAPRSSTAPVGRKCLTPGCTRYGDPAMSDLCTSCYHKTQNAVPNSPLTPMNIPSTSNSATTNSQYMDNFQLMMNRVESQKRFPRHCKAANCTNYGNPNNEGFCNGCYPRYLAMKENLRS